MRDFDVVRAENREHGDRRFKIGGQEFEFRAYSSPELYAATWVAENDLEWLAAADAFILGVLITSDKEKWVKVRATDAAEPLSFTDVRDVMDFVLEVTSGRPTVPSSDSSDTSSERGTSSTAKSVSSVEVSTGSISGGS